MQRFVSRHSFIRALSAIALVVALLGRAAPAHAAGDEQWIDGFYSNGMNARVSAFTVWNNKLVAAGLFTTAGGTFANRGRRV